MRPTIHTKQFFRASLLVVAMLLLTGAIAGNAQAKVRDRNHDGISDRWEKRHHLSLRVNQASRDQDHDGVNNLCESEASLNPHAKDSNRNGVRDGAEDSDDDGISNRVESRHHLDCDHEEGDNSGTVVSFTDGTLVIKTGTDANGEAITVTGTVTAATLFECSFGDDDHGDCHNAAPDPTAAVSHNGGEGESESENEVENENEGEGEDHPPASCSAADLVPGALIHEAKLVDGVFTKIEIAK